MRWTTVVHPEGSRYFVNQENRTCTEMNVCDEEICGDIEWYMQYLLRALESKCEGRELDMMQVDLVLEPKKAPDSDSIICWYYFVNHRDRCLFWLDEFDTEYILSHCKGVESLSHIQLSIQAQYWKHWDYFPSLCSVTQNLVDEVKDMLVHATCDHLTSRRSSAPYDLIQLRDYISVIDNVNVYSPTDQSAQRCHPAIVIGRIMHTFSHSRFLDFHGEDCARLIFGQTVHGWAYEPSLLMLILAPLLFLDPVTQVKELHNIFADRIACTPRWDAYTSKLRGQLQDSNLMATVLLNANVGFLAINTVDKGGRSAVQMASYMSLVTSLGSIVLGLLFVSQDRTCGQKTAEEIALFLTSLHDERHGLEKLAIIYSLPKALLMWGMVFFCAAFSIDWWSSGDATSKAVVGSVTLIVFVMISNSIIRTREGENSLHGEERRETLTASKESTWLRWVQRNHEPMMLHRAAPRSFQPEIP
ncbi:uncharacterized protein EDB91DRAFT_381128 [Suillus paluster]|uniref:uncharacterized protein n=1 Tax=Suillus paluster TaxID=48578 RepID=UPI001B886608|nr:uncharacterized protein EDB91DRAFT_381128 [Suillus paluster]KAG1739393.1 hypothetical protein EDB91DRAFT_381128 [Suillus paluster]